MWRATGTVLVVVLSFGVASASAATIYSTLDKTIIGGDGDLTGPAGRWVANCFSVSDESIVEQYRVAVVAFGDINIGALSLWSGVAAPTTLIESDILFSIPQSPPTGEGWAIITVPSVATPTLTPGGTYWVALHGNGGNTNFNWWYVSQPGTVRLWSTGGSSWHDAGNVPSAFDVQGRLIPEPATLALLAAGAIGLQRRRA